MNSGRGGTHSMLPERRHNCSSAHVTGQGLPKEERSAEAPHACSAGSPVLTQPLQQNVAYIPRQLRPLDPQAFVDLLETWQQMSRAQLFLSPVPSPPNSIKMSEKNNRTEGNSARKQISEYQIPW